MKTHDTLIFIPTYNERENVGTMCAEILALGLQTDLVFMDDASPDGTGELLDQLAAKHPTVRVIHRTGKLGIGSAHLEGIAWAYEQGYRRLLTMDCDFTHSPTVLPEFLEKSRGFDVTLGSRFLHTGSLPGWNLLRRFLTHLGHFLTRHLLRIRYDATGALRVYDLERIPREFFGLIQARGYAFFFESLFTLVQNGHSVKELPIVLPARTYGHSKMTLRETLRSTRQLFSLNLASFANPARFRLGRPVKLDPTLVDPQNWDPYWERKDHPGTLAYELVAAIYRRGVIKPQLERFLNKHFTPGDPLLHAGCGSGQVDVALQARFHITAVDISPAALLLYSRNNPAAAGVKHASILALPFADDSFAGAYNLGVLEHFTAEEIRQILRELHRVLRPGGKIVIFWPHHRASSVIFLKGCHWVLHRVMKSRVQLHPPEISLLRSRQLAGRQVEECGFRMVDYYFGVSDLWVQAALVAEKPEPTP